jgi:hypothetical protein
MQCAPEMRLKTPRDRCAKRQVCQETGVPRDRCAKTQDTTGQAHKQEKQAKTHDKGTDSCTHSHFKPRERERELSLSRALSLCHSLSHTHTHTNTHTHTHTLSLSRTHTQDSRRLTLMHTYECTRGIDTRSARLGKKKLTDSDILQHNFILQHYFICPNTQTGVKGFIEYTSSH